jgi:solute carrier family 50 (sugar transporter)
VDQGWCAYGYYTHDPFVLASNLPGLILSLWLNMGAAKLQYLALRPPGEAKDHTQQGPQEPQQDDTENESSYLPPDVPGAGVLPQGNNDAVAPLQPATAKGLESFVVAPQEAAFLRIVLFWAIVLVWVGWVHPSKSTPTILGLVVNVNLIFFYGAPLQSMGKVITEKNSGSIHAPTMVMNWLNTSFWLLYGAAKVDPIIFVPNLIGLMLGITQGLLYGIYPTESATMTMNDEGFEPLLQEHPEIVQI